MKNIENYYEQNKNLFNTNSSMKVEVQKDIQISQLRLTPASKFIVEPTRFEKKKKGLKKGEQMKRRELRKLKQIVQRQKISTIKKEFVRKLKLMVPHKIIPSQLLLFRKQPTDLFDQFVLKLEQMQGFKMSSTFLFVWRFIMLVKVIIILVITSLLLVFQQVHGHHIFSTILQISILISMGDICMNLVFQKFQNNKNRRNVLSIAKLYIKNDFIIDFLTTIVCIFLIFSVTYPCITLLILLCLIKMSRSLQRIQILQHIYITSVFQEKYYSIGKVIFLNFLIAHFIAIIALLMAKMNEENNWLTQKQISNADWVEKYIWACYWAVNMMLTVGFGDISACNYNQALILIFVQTFSCIILAYNINVVGSILTDIKQKQRQRKSQLRTILKMSNENEIQSQLVEQAINYVDQSFKIKQKFCYEHHDSIVQTLPESMQQEYIKHGNKKMILELPLVNLFSNKSLMKIALIINRKLAHPEQFIWKKGEPMRLAILKKGKIGLVHRRGNSKLNGQIIQSLQINEKKSKLLSLSFLRSEQFSYDIKSLDYSVIYHLSQQQFAEALKCKSSDYELYCSFRDKCEFKLESGDLYQCNFCVGENHNHFSCPKMHLVLVRGYIIYKNVFCKKNTRNIRQLLPRRDNRKPFLKLNKIIKSQIQSFNMIYCINYESQKPLRNTSTCSQKGISYSSKGSINKNVSQSNLFNMDIQRLNTFLAAKMNQKQLCVGFWQVEGDISHNFISYFRSQNPDFINRQNRRFQRNNSVTLNLNQNIL